MHKDESLVTRSLPSPYQNNVLNAPKTALDAAENLVKFIFSDAQFTLHSLSTRSFNAIFYKKDWEFLLICQNEMQRLLFNLFKTEHDDELFSIVVGLVLSLLPYMEPKEGSCFFIPQKIAGVWGMCEFEVEHIQLTPSYLGTCMLAFGLIPKAAGMQPLLLFMGTPLPTGTGNLLSIWTDFVPGCCVGELVYKSFVKEKCSLWIDKMFAKLNQKVKIYGHSLGGTLALLAIRSNKDKISEVHAYSPALPFKRNIGKVLANDAPLVNVFFRERDPVFYTGTYIDSNWQLYCIKSPRKQNYFFAHIRVCPAFSGVTIEKLNPDSERKKLIRKLITIGHFLISIPLFVLLTVSLLLKSAYWNLKSAVKG
jgi:hypothetical protein